MAFIRYRLHEDVPAEEMEHNRQVMKRQRDVVRHGDHSIFNYIPKIGKWFEVSKRCDILTSAYILHKTNDPILD
jgi:hypothetical protein